MEAYRYAEGVPDENGNLPPQPRQYIDLGYIDRFGVRAVMGRDELAFHEIQEMLAAENAIDAYLSRKASGDWGKWAQENPRVDALLKQIEIIIHAEDRDD